MLVYFIAQQSTDPKFCPRDTKKDICVNLGLHYTTYILYHWELSVMKSNLFFFNAWHKFVCVTCHPTMSKGKCVPKCSKWLKRYKSCCHCLTLIASHCLLHLSPRALSLCSPLYTPLYRIFIPYVYIKTFRKTEFQFLGFFESPTLYNPIWAFMADLSSQTAYFFN